MKREIKNAFGSIRFILKHLLRQHHATLRVTYDESALEDLEINPKQVERGELIAHGFSAEVFKAVWKGTDVVLKELHWKSRLPEKKADAFRKELTLLVKFRHPNLVLVIGAVTRTLPYSLVLEFCSGGTLFDLLHKRPLVNISWRQRMKITLDIAKAVNYLHHLSPVVIHRDLKSLNVLLAEEVADEYDTPIAKVADFGLSTWAPFTTPGRAPDESCQSLVGTYHWMAPEVIQSHPYNDRIDAYAFGIILFELCSRTIPYSRTNLQPLGLAKAVTKGLRPEISDVDPDFPRVLIDLMLQCWSFI